MTTVRDLIRQSLGLIHVVGAGENMTAEDANDTLRLLNQMLSSWSSDGAIIYNRSVDTLALSAGVQSYTMGPTGTIATTRPVGITQATITLGGVVTQMNIWSSNTISTLDFPTLQGGTPYDLYVNNSVPNLEFKLFPIPSGGQTLTIYSLKPLATLTLDTVLELPPGYEMALMLNLAVFTAPFYEKEVMRTTVKKAYETLSTIKANNLQYSTPTMGVDAALDVRWSNNGNTWGYNIYGGY